VPVGIAVSRTDVVFVTGTSPGEGRSSNDFVTIAYAAKTGSPQDWTPPADAAGFTIIAYQA
jgi:hypothetical protein